jgi:putative ABC transport system permease protein
MVLRDLISDVVRTLWAHKLRTFLTMFGIAWGIVSIVLMVAAGEGLRKGQEEQTRTLGKDILIVFHGRTSLQAGGARAERVVRWEDEDVAAVQAESPDCEYAIPELEQNDVRAHSDRGSNSVRENYTHPPPRSMISSVSARNCSLMCHFFAPRARRRPISRMRSSTEARFL